MNAIPQESIFVSTAWPSGHLNAPDVAVIDATFLLPTDPRNAKAEYLDGHIPGAVFFDIDAIADHTTPLPHMLPPLPPSPRRWKSLASATACALSFMILPTCKAAPAFGGPCGYSARRMSKSSPAVCRAGGPRNAASNKIRAAPAQAFHRAFQSRRRCRRGGRAESERNRLGPILDARPGSAVSWHVARAAPGLRSGHVPGSLNLPWGEVVAAGEIKPKDELALGFAQAGIDFTRPVITTCGSGVTAAIFLLALETAGQRPMSRFMMAHGPNGARPICP